MSRLTKFFRFAGGHSEHIRIWYGERQQVGNTGNAQSDFNLVGEVSHNVVSLSCSVNGVDAPWTLSIGRSKDGFGDGRRLARTGHFNADIPVDCLRFGENQVKLIAQTTWGRQVERVVTINRHAGCCSRPLSIDWNGVEHPQDVGQCVDGEWRIENGALRTWHTGYDRIFLLGCVSWRDYTVTVPVTIHHVERQTGPFSGPNGLGILFRFTGHVIGGPRNFPPGQPKWGYQPFGAIAWLRWSDGSDQLPQKQFFRGDANKMNNHGVCPVKTGSACWMKGACETLSETVTRYRFKIWEDGYEEPEQWDWEEEQSSDVALRCGSVGLLAHHVDASFGPVMIEESEGADCFLTHRALAEAGSPTSRHGPGLQVD